MKSLLSLTIVLVVFLIGTVRAGGPINLQLGGLALNNKGLKLDAAKRGPGLNGAGGDLGITVMPSLKDVLDITSRPLPPGAVPATKIDRIKKSYEDQIMEEISRDKPTMEEINARRHEAAYYHTSDEAESADATCDEGDTACEKEMMMWAAAPSDPKLDKKDKKAKKAKRDKKYEWAVKKGTDRANADMKKAGGPDPYGGFLPPSLVEKDLKTGKEDAKEARDETKGTKTLKGSKKGDKKDKDDKGKKGKAKKAEVTTKEEEVDVATAPDR